MIFQQKQLAKKGISLIEVIITISIIGILSSAVVPTYQFFNKKKEELELEKNILVIDNNFKAYLAVNHRMEATHDYPLLGIKTSTDYIGYLNITKDIFYSFSKKLCVSCDFLYPNLKKEYDFETTAFSNNLCTAFITLYVNDGSKIKFKYEVSDNQINFLDRGYLKEVTYYLKDDLYKTIIF